MNRVDCGTTGIDQFSAFRRVIFGQECIQGRRTDGRVGYEPTRVGKCDPQRLDLQMQSFGGQWVKPSEVKRFQDIQRQQCGKSLAVRRTLPEADAAVCRADRLLPGASVFCQVLFVEHSAGSLDGGRDIAGDVALIEGQLAAFSDNAQGSGKSGIAEDFSCMRCATSDRELQAAQGIAQLALHTARPEVRSDGRHRKSFLGQPDGRRQDPGHRKPAVPLDQVAPPGACTGHCDRVCMEWGQRRPEAFPGKPVQRQRCRRAARSVERGDMAGSGLIVERKAVAADSGRCRFGHVECRRGSDCCIGRVASSCKDVQPGCHGQRL